VYIQNKKTKISHRPQNLPMHIWC